MDLGEERWKETSQTVGIMQVRNGSGLAKGQYLYE